MKKIIILTTTHDATHQRRLGQQSSTAEAIYKTKKSYL